jgi:hypothetical protein
LRGEADIVIGDRQTQTITEFSPVKKLLQRVGSWTIRKLSGASEVKDAISGFRAYSRHAASRIYLANSYSYAIESIIQAGKRGLRIVSIPLKTNPKTRPSRLFHSIRGFVARSGTTLLRSYLLYEPLKVFNLMAAFSLFIGTGLGGRFIYLEFTDQANSHTLSLILTGFFFIEGLFLAALGMVTDHIAANRKLLEELVWREKAVRQRLLDSTLGVGTLDWDSTHLIAEALPQLNENKAPATAGKYLDDAMPQLTIATSRSE